MELTENFIAGLAVDEVGIMKRISGELGIRVEQVSTVVGLIAEGCTVPFISRYRKERTGSLDEVQVRDIAHAFSSGKNLEERRVEVIRGIFALGKLDETLYASVSGAATLSEIEDLWTPFKKKKKTRGMLAREKGLEPLAEIMLRDTDATVEAAAAGFVRQDPEHPELSVASAADALAGARDIIAERVSQNPENRAVVKAHYLKHGFLRTAGVGDEAKREASTYQMYWDYAEPLGQLKPHRVLAVNRAEREGELTVTIDVDEEGGIELLKDRASIHNTHHANAISDGLLRLLSPAVVREIRSDAGEYADHHGIGVFSQNLRNLLMSPPIKGTRVVGVDPGIRTGTKCGILDERGKFLDYFVIFQEQKPDEARKTLAAAVKKHGIALIAIGNGTGSHDVQALVAQTIEENALDCAFTVVDEDGASVYSASDVAREEFPDLDLTIRGAISIGRRLQDPLSELVKIDPKSIGVGLYQHDVNQKRLSESLDEVVASVVNNVGVNINTASHSILRYVSGINSGLAKKIVKYRDGTGTIAGRDRLREIPGMGEKSFEQCAGFLKIPESPNPLDNTWVHPENYPLAEELFPLVREGVDIVHETRIALKQKYGVGDTTLDDIVAELRKPNRDPREGLPAAILQKGVVRFEDLAVGLSVRGKVKNVVDFGAFVDIGIKESALIHVSEMSDRFVKDPMDVLKVGDVKDFSIISLDPVRKRIGLSLKTGAGSRDRRQADGRHEVRKGAGEEAGPEHGRGSGPDRERVQTRESGGRRAVVHSSRGQTGRPGDAGSPGSIPVGTAQGGPGAGRPESAGNGRRDGRTEPRPGMPGRPPMPGRTVSGPGGPGGPGDSGPRRDVRPSRPGGDAPPRRDKEDDGMTYNPFAELLRNRKR